MYRPSPHKLHESARRAVSIVMADGTARDGQLVVPVARTIGEMLNGPHGFFEFETSDGEKIFLAKTAIQSVKIRDVPHRDVRPRHHAA